MNTEQLYWFTGFIFKMQMKQCDATIVGSDKPAVMLWILLILGEKLLSVLQGIEILNQKICHHQTFLLTATHISAFPLIGAAY